MRLDVGPVAPASAVAWMTWADRALTGLNVQPASRTSPSSTGVLVDVGSYLRRWMPCTGSLPESLQRHAEVDPDEVEYLVHAFFNLDTQLSDEVRRKISVVPSEGRTFYLVLVGALLHALETQSPSRAAFVTQLRSSWPIAVEAN